LEDISNLKKLKKLVASGISLKKLTKLNGLTQIQSLDISNNDFSNASEEDIQALINLYNLEEIDISKSHIPDELLNTFFGSIYQRKTLKKFVDANPYPGTSLTAEQCSFSTNNFKIIDNCAYSIYLAVKTPLSNHNLCRSLPKYRQFA